MSPLILLVAAMASMWQPYRCPEDVSYNLLVKGNHLTVVRAADKEYCVVKGTNAHCRVVGTNGLNGDVYDMYARITPEAVTLNAPRGVICKNEADDPMTLTLPQSAFE